MQVGYAAGPGGNLCRLANAGRRPGETRLQAQHFYPLGGSLRRANYTTGGDRLAGGDMRTPLSIVLVLAGAVGLAGLAAPSTAEARKKRYYQPGYEQPSYYQPPGNDYRQPRYSRERQLCEERAQAADPTGLYAGYPCWAREAFGREPGGGRR